MTDAHARLLAYLRQRRELGESEFVLDGLSVEEAYRVLAQRATPPSAPAGAPSPAGARSTAPGVFEARPIPTPPDSASRRVAAEAAKDGDWREALKAIDAAPASRAKTPPARPVGRSEGPAAESAPAAEEAVPAALASRSTAPVPPQDTAYRFEVGAGAPGSGLTDLTSLDAVAAAIARCGACALGATARNHVPGEGNPLARFVVVGEAPGETEDELGRPFVGKSGELLNKILDAIGFKREDVFICNVLKHRPPGNRNPTPAEIVACRPFLLRQLELLQPKVILALGTFAAQTLLETDSPIGKLRGLEHRYHGIPLVATYHPAALLRNPNWKRPAWEDVQLARRIFDRP
ncbi:MAG: uracil-DNA glycosylase [Gemmatimonadetes bacterium]|nr:uracil-DNA glycosylase [Gemmatimonadota bacterium]